MVSLALTPAGLSEAIALSDRQSPVWCSASAIGDPEFSGLAAQNVTRFVHSLSGPNQAELVADALATIAEHHPNQRVWVENASAP